MPGLVLADFEWAEVVLDFHSEFTCGAGAAVTLSKICGYSPRVRAVIASGEPELGRMNGLPGPGYDLKLRIGDFLSVLLGAGNVQLPRRAG